MINQFLHIITNNSVLGLKRLTFGVYLESQLIDFWNDDMYHWVDETYAKMFEEIGLMDWFQSNGHDDKNKQP